MIYSNVAVLSVLALLSLTVHPGHAAMQEPSTKLPAAAPTDASGLLEEALRAIGGQLPRSVTITAAGSGYAPAAGGSRTFFRIQSYTMQTDLAASSGSETLVRLEQTEGDEDAPQTDTRTFTGDSPWPEQHLLWTNPFGFLARAASGKATVASETLFGSSYQVVTVTVPSGQEVQGWLTEEHVLERIRTEVQDPAGTKRHVETIFFDWEDFKGIKYPSLVILKENGELARVLVIGQVETQTPS